MQPECNIVQLVDAIADYLERDLVDGEPPPVNVQGRAASIALFFLHGQGGNGDKHPESAPPSSSA